MTLNDPLATGAPRMATHFAAALVDSGASVRVIHGRPSAHGRATTVVDALGAAGVTTTAVGPMYGANLPRVLARSVRAARSADVIVGFQGRDRQVAMLTSILVRRPVVLHVSTPARYFGGRASRRLKLAVTRWLLRRSGATAVAVAPHVADELFDHLHVARERIHVVRDGIPMSPVSDRRSTLTDGPSSPPRITSVGSLIVTKGHDLLVAALSSLGDVAWSCSIVGARIELSEHRQYAERLEHAICRSPLGGRIRLEGWRDDVGDVLASTDLYVHPSRSEGWPLAVVEAFRSGVPVIMSDCSGRPPGWVDGEHGWIVPTDEVPALASAIRHALSLPADELERVGAAGRRYCEQHFAIERSAAAFVDIVTASANVARG